MTGIALGLVALLLVGPGPLWVVRWDFLRWVPRAAVVLWQAGTVAALISVIGAGVVIGLGWLRHPNPSVVEQLLSFVIVIFTAIVIIRLSWSLIAVARDTGARRSRHRHAVDLLGQIDETSALPGLRILAESLPIAYCLPGLRGSRVVLSKGTLATLRADEVAAVLAHESAHVRARHDLVLDTFSALHRAFPIAVRSEIPLLQCQLLVEMLADDVARKRTGALPLARALVVMADSPVPQTALGAATFGTAARIARLAEPMPKARALSCAVYLLAAGLVALPVIMLGLSAV